MRIAADNRRNCRASYFDWVKAEHPDYGTPGSGCLMHGDCFVFACPGCGRFGSIRIGRPKPAESPSWEIVAGEASNPESLTLKPSINCVGCCGWHGYLTLGTFETC